MIVSFADDGTEDIYDGDDTNAARKCCPRTAWTAARRKLDQLDAVTSLRSLALPGNNVEKLKGDREGQFSIRVNRQYRICFRWTDSGPPDVEIVDYH